MTKKAIQSFAYSEKDSDVVTVVNEDDWYADDHPFVKARPAMFRDLNEDRAVIEAPKKAKVEQATAAPGESRAVKKP